ncbi:hypothetical protein HWV62_8539 [Athelia sp. TMB]|nr:hypothetical protein HWV62_8539 [Athelia sp. TMB]
MASNNGGAKEPTAGEVVDGLLKKDAAKGAAVHSFDPNASPAEKAAVAGKARDQLTSVQKNADGGARGVALDTGHTDIVPTITVSDADAASKSEYTKSPESDEPIPITAPGALPDGINPAIPDWYKVGWRQVGGIDKGPLPEGELKDLSVLDMFLKEQYYGDWYYNAGVIVFAVFTTHFLTRFGFGWGWLFILLAICNTYYSTSMERVRRRARDDIQRDLLKPGIPSGYESAEWMNNFLDRFWKIYEPVLSATIVSSVDQILSTSTPAFLDSLRLSTFTLGTKAPRIQKVYTFPREPDDIVKMDWHIAFTPCDVSNITPNEAKDKVNPKIVLDVRVGKGLATAAMPILLEDLEFTGKMRIRLKLMTNFPHVQLVDLSFTEKPVFDYVLKPIGGDTFGFDIGNIPGLSGFIRDTVHSILQPMMYEPNVFTLNLEQMLSGAPLDTAIGVVHVKVRAARSIKGVKFGGGTPDPYVKISVNNRETLGKTHYKKSTTNPTWDESLLLLHSNNPVWESSTEFLCADRASSVVAIQIIDDRDFLKDPTVGFLSIKLEDLLEAKKEAGRDWWPLSQCKSGKVRLSVEWKPLQLPGSLAGAGQYTPPIGVVRLWLQKATDVKNVEATLGGKSDPYVRVQVGGVTRGRTEVINNNLNPEWDQIIYVPVHSLKESLFLECMDYQHLTKDRTLGSVELHVNEIAKASEGNPEYPFEGTGKKTAIEQIHLDHGQYKGQLHYVAEFIPALALAGVKFESGLNTLQEAAEDGGGSDGDTVDDGSSDEDLMAGIPQGVTVHNPLSEEDETPEAKQGHTRAAKSTDTTNTTNQPGSTHTRETTKVGDENAGVTMPREELLKQQSGVIVFNVISGQIIKKARLEVLMDDGYWPAFTTAKSPSTHARWQHVGEGFVKELDFGRVWLRLNENDEGGKDEIIAEWKGDAKAFLEATLTGSSKFTLEPTNGGGESIVEIESRYVPVPVKLEARESINNQGMLRVDILDGKDILAADRGGKSDPFVVFSLNGQKVFKSQTKKKTLNPEWNENFTVSVPSRVGANFTVEVFDWNQVEQAKSLGSGTIELADLEPFQGTESHIVLSTPKGGQKGEVRIRLMFQPEIIAKARKNTSTFSAAGRAMTQLGGLPMGAAVGAGKGVISGVGGIFGKKEKDFAKQNGGVPPVPNLPSGQASHPIGQPETLSTSADNATLASNGHGNTEPGTLRVTVLNAKDLSISDSKAYCSLRIGDKEYKTKHSGKTAAPEWNESFTFSAGPLTPKLFLWIFDHKTLGKDKQLGTAEVDLWRHLKQGQTSAADVSCELTEGQGLLYLRLEFDADTETTSSSIRRVSTAASSERNVVTSPSRFSLRVRRPTGVEDS